MDTSLDIADCAEDTELLANLPSIELNDYLDDLESLHRSMEASSDEQHTAHEFYDFSLKLDEEHNKVVVQPENKSIRLIFASIALVEYLKRNQIEVVYFPTRLARYYAPDKIVIGMINEVIIHLHFQQAEYHCEHYECVVEASRLLMPYLDDLCIGLKSPLMVVSHQESEFALGQSRSVNVAEMINDFVKRLFNLCHATKFLIACAQRKKRSRLHFKTAEKYLRELPKNFGRLLVIRLDLHLPQDNKNMPIDELKHKFGTFLQKIRRKRLINLKGYVWKLEYGFHQSFHYHCLFFLDGRKHAQDIKLAQMLGEIWDQIIEGEHCYFNCNHPKYLKRFQEPITGRLEPYDQKKYDRLLNHVIRYLCKKDQFIIHRSIAHKKTFDTGRLPYIKKNLGRPRTHISKY